ncbi:MAG: dimethylsulfoniopropionate lyase [Rhodospirillales bacterium]|nr:dimethylsulfoniopropionate lyase [Rhodospirillales bacterium]
MIDGLLREIRALCARGIEARAEGSEHLPAILDAIGRAPAPVEVAAQSKPTVERQLPGALALAEQSGDGALARALRGSAKYFAWQDMRYDTAATPEMARFIDNYAYAPVLGPDIYGPMNLIPCDRVFFGFTLQAPGVLYPAHGHRATELYYVIAGRAEWRRGAEDWVLRPPGSFLLHGPDMAHAMRTLDEPLLAFVAWVSDLDCASWVGESPPA